MTIAVRGCAARSVMGARCGSAADRGQTFSVGAGRDGNDVPGARGVQRVLNAAERETAAAVAHPAWRHEVLGRTRGNGERHEHGRHGGNGRDSRPPNPHRHECTVRRRTGSAARTPRRRFRPAVRQSGRCPGRAPRRRSRRDDGRRRCPPRNGVASATEPGPGPGAVQVARVWRLTRHWRFQFYDTFHIAAGHATGSA